MLHSEKCPQMGIFDARLGPKYPQIPLNQEYLSQNHIFLYIIDINKRFSQLNAGLQHTHFELYIVFMT
jgi:hypothetical protein